MDRDRFLNDDRPLEVFFRGERRCASWQDCEGDVCVHSAYGSRRVKFSGKDRQVAKRKAEKLFLEILEGTRH